MMTTKSDITREKRTPSLWSAFSSLLFVLSVVGANPAKAQLTTVTDMKDKDWTNTALYFYPSTLRMINLEQIEEFDRLIEDIDKMVLYTMNNKFDEERFYEVINKLMSDDNMEEYFVIDGNGKKFYLLGRESPAETVGIAELDGARYVFDITGELALSEIPKLYRFLSENDKDLGSKYASLLGIFDQSNLEATVNFKQ